MAFFNLGMVMILKKITLACMILGGATLMTACGGGGSSTPLAISQAPTVTSNVKSNDNAAVLGAVGTTPVTFANGFSGVDGSGNPVSISGATTVAFGSTGAGPVATISNGGFTASGPTTFGSCIFTFTTSNYADSSPLGKGKQFRVDPCTLNVNTAGFAANGNAINTTGFFNFGVNNSAPFVVSPVTINANGTVFLGTTSVGTVTVSNVTGGSN
jgi:hypothetical protein